MKIFMEIDENSTSADSFYEKINSINDRILIRINEALDSDLMLTPSDLKSLAFTVKNISETFRDVPQSFLNTPVQDLNDISDEQLLRIINGRG